MSVQIDSAIRGARWVFQGGGHWTLERDGRDGGPPEGLGEVKRLDRWTSTARWVPSVGGQAIGPAVEGFEPAMREVEQWLARRATT